MTKDETIKLLMCIQAAYPNYKIPDKNVAVNMWSVMLEDFDYRIVAAALKAYIATDTSGFAPSIGQIISKLQVILHTEQNEMAPTEAWSLVSRALRNSTYNSRAEFDRLPEPVQKAVGSPHMLYEWATDDNFNESVISSNFIKSYTQIMAKKKEYETLPESVKKIIGIADKGELENGCKRIDGRREEESI